MPLKNFALMASYVFEKPSRIPNLIRNQAVSRTFVSKNDLLKLAYIVNPKVASSSIVLLLGGDIDVGSLKGKSIKEKHAMLSKEVLHSYDEIDLLKNEGYFVFSFVRNPYSRIVSFFKNKFEPANNGLLRPKQFAIKRQFRNLRDFDGVARTICDTPDYLSDAHFMSQTRILFGPDGRNRLDFIGKLENMEHDFGIISRQANLGAIARTNSTSANHEWMDYFTVELADMVHKRFESDFKLLGYEDEHRSLMEYLHREEK